MGIFLAILVAILPSCAEESDTNCYWDAEERGNGIGTSFISIADTVLYF